MIHDSLMEEINYVNKFFKTKPVNFLKFHKAMSCFCE